ncbi:hypothetical protein SPSIL_015000 [Sporomusa silvacetica DSM 10669]|uniref:Uncharacterized protein n=1 Tax=Sporomusa silvacetica DSM 10669 TaxID=1123289 RepID=A0ABZ3IIA9_9FIRM|nr:hypothetical protein SPSIL_09730 [Sporomusa silvacetica DSM 10669]
MPPIEWECFLWSAVGGLWGGTAVFIIAGVVDWLGKKS